jgi:hypothetical protein
MKGEVHGYEYQMKKGGIKQLWQQASGMIRA